LIIWFFTFILQIRLLKDKKKTAKLKAAGDSTHTVATQPKVNKELVRAFPRATRSLLLIGVGFFICT